MGNTATPASAHWLGKKPRPVPPVSWKALGMERGGPSDDAVCPSENCWVVRYGDIRLHAWPDDDGDGWFVWVDTGTNDEASADRVPAEAEAIRACAWLLTQPDKP